MKRLDLTDELRIIFYHLNPTMEEAKELAERVAKGYWSDNDIRELVNQIYKTIEK